MFLSFNFPVQLHLIGPHNYISHKCKNTERQQSSLRWRLQLDLILLICTSIGCGLRTGRKTSLGNPSTILFRLRTLNSRGGLLCHRIFRRLSSLSAPLFIRHSSQRCHRRFNCKNINNSLVECRIAYLMSNKVV